VKKFSTNTRSGSFILKHIIFLCLLLLLFLAQAAIFPKAHAQSLTTNCTVASSLLIQTENEKKLLALINNYRAQNGRVPLVWSPDLKRAAAWMNNDMNTKSYFSHTDSAGRDTGTRLTQCGYSWKSFGENIYPNSSDPQAAFDAWKNSPPHKANMLDERFNEAGIGSGGTYWTLDLGSSTTSSNTQPTINPTTGVTPSLTVTPSPTPSPIPTPSIILNPTDTKIRVSIRLAGIGQGGNASPKHLTRQVVVDIFDLGNRKVVSGNGYLKFNNKDGFVGDIHLGQLANGVYYAKVVSVNTLTALVVPEFQTINFDKPNILPQVILTHGDLDSNNVIDIEDFNLALPCFQNTKCESQNIIDFNDDGKADVRDYNIFLSSFKRFEGD
jgi:uncharacterized protein YkwD